jgi:hypothetical protein
VSDPQSDTLLVNVPIGSLLVDGEFHLAGMTVVQTRSSRSALGPHFDEAVTALVISRPRSRRRF